MRFLNSVVNTWPPSLKKDGNSPSGPNALQLLRKRLSLITVFSRVHSTLPLWDTSVQAENQKSAERIVHMVMEKQLSA